MSSEQPESKLQRRLAAAVNGSPLLLQILEELAGKGVEARLVLEDGEGQRSFRLTLAKGESEFRLTSQDVRLLSGLGIDATRSGGRMRKRGSS